METKTFIHFNDHGDEVGCDLKGSFEDLVNMICNCMNENKTIEQIVLIAAKVYEETKNEEGGE